MVTTFDKASDVIQESDSLDSIYTVELMYGHNVFDTISVPFNFTNSCLYTKYELNDVFEYLGKKFDEMQRQAYTGLRISIFVKPGKKREVTHFRQEITVQAIRQLIPKMKDQFIEKLVFDSVWSILAKITE